MVSRIMANLLTGPDNGIRLDEMENSFSQIRLHFFRITPTSGWLHASLQYKVQGERENESWGSAQGLPVGCPTSPSKCHKAVARQVEDSRENVLECVYFNSWTIILRAILNVGTTNATAYKKSVTSVVKLVYIYN